MIQLLLQFCSIQQLFQLFTNLNDGDEEEEKCNIQSQNELLLQRISLLNKQIRIRDKKFGDLS